MANLLYAFIIMTLSMGVNARDFGYKVKADYLYNFTKFVTWPKLEGESFNVCILGSDPFGQLISQIEQKTVAGYPVKLIRLVQFDAAKRCHMLYIAQSSERLYPSSGYPEGILTVGESEYFIEQGGMFALNRIDGTIRLKINMDACIEKKLTVSVKLLEVAEWIGGRDD
ncbi:MAG: YfiR family protein [Gammaproteobacteria bacterium]